MIESISNAAQDMLGATIILAQGTRRPVVESNDRGSIDVGDPIGSRSARVGLRWMV
jgi:hypothetical protein